MVCIVQTWQVKLYKNTVWKNVVLSLLFFLCQDWFSQRVEFYVGLIIIIIIIIDI